MSKNVVESWQIDPQAGPDNLEAKQPFIDNGLDVYGRGMGQGVDALLAGRLY